MILNIINKKNNNLNLINNKLYKKNNDIVNKNNLVKKIIYHMNDMLTEKNKIVKFKNEFTKFIEFKNSFPHHLLFELFYEKYNHFIIPYQILDEYSFYYKYILSMINIKSSLKCTDLNVIQMKLSNILDINLYKNPFCKKNILIEKNENNNERNHFYKYNENEDIFVKKVNYIKYKINESEYEVEFDVFDKINELLIQTNIYNYYENLIYNKKICYNPIPKIYQFYHNISEIDKCGNILNDIYIEMENIDGIKVDNYIHKKIIRPKDGNIYHSIKDILNLYIMVCRMLIPLQQDLNFIHCDLKGSNILIDKNRRLRLIDFEYSYIKKDGFHIFSHYDFSFSGNYNIFKTDTFFNLDLIKLYTSEYRFCSDILYMLLTTLHYKNDNYGIQRYIIDKIFKIGHINMFEVLITNKLPYEAYVYSKDMDLLQKICNMYFVNFEQFILRFYPENMINILNIILEELK